MGHDMPPGHGPLQPPESGHMAPGGIGFGAFPPPPGLPYPPMYAPVVVGQPSDNSGGMAIAGFVLGILSIPVAFIAICGVAFGLLGIILSALGIRSLDRRGMAIAGLALAIVGVLLGIANGVFGYLYTMNHYLYGPYAP